MWFQGVIEFLFSWFEKKLTSGERFCLFLLCFVLLYLLFFFWGGGGGHLDTRLWGTATKALILPSGERQNVDVSGHCPPTPYPSPKPTLTLTSHSGQSVGLGEGSVGRFPET